jgi:hypothetical protein
VGWFGIVLSPPEPAEPPFSPPAWSDHEHFGSQPEASPGPSGPDDGAADWWVLVPGSLLRVPSRAVVADGGATAEVVVVAAGSIVVGAGVVTAVVITDGGRLAAWRGCGAPRRAWRRRTVTCCALGRSENARTGTARVALRAAGLEPRWR